MTLDAHEKKIQIRSVIRFLSTKGKTGEDIQLELLSAFGSPLVPLNTIYFWVKKFKTGTISVEDEERVGRPRIEGLAEMITRELENDMYLSARELANILNVCKNTIIKVLKEDLKMNKVNFRWIPHILSDELKQKRVKIAKNMLNTMKKSKIWANI